MAARARAFTLAEVIVVLGVVAVLAVIVLPTVIGRISESKSSALAKTLDGLREGLLEYRADVRRFPSHLRYLSAAPGSATDICGQSVPASFLASWKGPYVNRSIGTNGIQIGSATVLDSVVRSPTTFTAGTTGNLFIRVQDVDSAVARRIERDQDVTPDFNAGTIRWSNVANGVGTLELVIPVRGC